MEFTVKAQFNASPEEIYTAWLDSEKHSEMTGGEAFVSNKPGETFTAWDGYIEGKNLELQPNKRIIQSWRTVEFADEEEDSNIEIMLEESGGGTALTLVHTNLPAHGEQYRQGWVDNYFEPMKNYFS